MVTSYQVVLVSAIRILSATTEVSFFSNRRGLKNKLDLIVGSFACTQKGCYIIAWGGTPGQCVKTKNNIIHAEGVSHVIMVRPAEE